MKDPEAKKNVEAVVKEHPTRTGVILLVTLGAIVGIGVVGTKLGIKFSN